MKINEVIDVINEQVIKNAWAIERKSINKYEAAERMKGFLIYTFEPESAIMNTTYQDNNKIPLVNTNPLILGGYGEEKIHGHGKYRVQAIDQKGYIFAIYDCVDGDMKRG